MTDEHERWLKAARPDTAADNGWTQSEQGRQALEAIHQSTATKPRRRFTWTVAAPIGLAGAAAAALVIATLGGSPRQHDNTPPQAAPNPRHHVGAVPAHLALVAYDDCASLLAGLRSHTAAHVTAYGLDQPYALRYGEVTPISAPAAAKADSGSAAPDHSTTNDQEADVDEPDVVKSDGHRIVSLTGGVLRVIDVASRKVTGSLDLNLYNGAGGAQLLVAGDRALVILGSYGYYYDYGPRAIGPAGAGEAGYILVDLSGAPKIIGTMQTKGNPVDARLVGSTVRFVVSSAPDIAFTQVRPNASDSQRLRANRAAVRRAPLIAWQPRYTISDAHGSRTDTVPCPDIRHPAVFTGTALTTVYTVDLQKDFSDLAPTSLAADGAVVYSTTASLYVTSTGEHNRTQLHRFDVSAPGKPAYLGTGTVPGSLLNAYSLSDYRDHLRVVTTSANVRGHSATALYDLDDRTLRVVGEIGGLGRNEQVQAVRFLDDLAYVVTFRQVDPLYVLDLANPAAPRVAGELKAPGYSAYLHPVGTGRLLGVGAEVDQYNEPFSIKLALLDVSNPARPHQLSQLVRSHVWASNVDPHAFLYWPDAHLVVVPSQSMNGDETTGALVVRIAGSSLRTIGVVHNPSTLNGDAGIERSLVVGDTLWTMSDAGLSVRDITSLHQQRWIPFD